MWSKIADGSWLTTRRMRAAGLLSGLATILSLLFLISTSEGTLDLAGRPLGSDFSNVWSAGRMALDGRAADAWVWHEHHAVQQAVHADAAVPFFGWHYPPPFLMLAALLALLPYLVALVAWQASTLAAALFLVTRILPSRQTLLLTLSAPVVLICLSHGHNGFF